MSDPIQRLEGELAKLGAEHEPPAGWQARVLAATAEKPRRRWWMFALPVVVAAAAVIALVLARKGPEKPQELAIAISIGSGGPIVRGTTAKVGDVVRATARARAVWIYREDRELLIACPGALDCSPNGDQMTAQVRLRIPGRYTVVALDKLVRITGSLDADLAAAHKAGATSRTETIEVR